MAPFRIAVPDSLRALLTPSPWVLVTPALPADERRRERWLRLWLERRAASGATPADAAAALQSPSLRAVLATLDHQADAALLDASEPASVPAWCFIEPQRAALVARACSQLWLGGSPEMPAEAFGWWEANPADSIASSAEQLGVAAAALARMAAHPVRVIAVRLLSGDARTAPSERWLATLTARVPSALVLPLYSPLFFRDGRLQLAPLLAELRRHAGPALPLLYMPQWPREEFAQAVAAARGSWSGPLLAGGEFPVARLRPDATALQARDLCTWLSRCV